MVSDFYFFFLCSEAYAYLNIYISDIKLFLTSRQLSSGVGFLYKKVSYLQDWGQAMDVYVIYPYDKNPRGSQIMRKASKIYCSCIVGKQTPGKLLWHSG